MQRIPYTRLPIFFQLGRTMHRFYHLAFGGFYLHFLTGVTAKTRKVYLIP